MLKTVGYAARNAAEPLALSNFKNRFVSIRLQLPLEPRVSR